jgi:hypothetical protein
MRMQQPIEAGRSSPRARSAPVVSFPVARAFAVVVTLAVWSVILAAAGMVFGHMLARPAVSPLALQVSLGIVVPLVGLFTAHGVLTGMLDGYVQGRFTPPRSAGPAAARNPWAHGLLACFVVGAPVAVAGMVAVGWVVGPGPALTPRAYAGTMGGLGLLVSGVVAWWMSGGPCARLLAAGEANHRYPGSPSRYLLRRHAGPQGAANLWINGWVAVALTPADGWAPAALVTGDAFVAGVIIAAAASFGARNHARADARSGLLGSHGTATPRWAHAGLVVGVGVVVAAATWTGLALLAVDGLALGPFVVIKGLTAGLIAAGAAWAGARWGLQERVREETPRGNVTVDPPQTTQSS